MAQLRVLTYNIQRGGQRGSSLDRVFREVAPDVAVVNEGPKAPLLWRRRRHVLAQRWGMRCAAGGRTAGANLVLVGPSVEVDAVMCWTLDTPGFAPRRGVVAAQLSVGERLLGVVGAHLSLRPRDRAHEVEEVLRAADRMRGAVVVAGDLNEHSDGPSWQRLRKAGFVDHGADDWLTFPAHRPERRIDALLVRGEVTVSHHGDPGVPESRQATASDHRAVLAVLEL